MVYCTVTGFLCLPMGRLAKSEGTPLLSTSNVLARAMLPLASLPAPSIYPGHGNIILNTSVTLQWPPLTHNSLGGHLVLPHNILLDVRRHHIVLLKLHRVLRTALGHAAQCADVLEHLAQRH